METKRLQGADVERLSECYAHAAKLGLKVGQDTQYGLNEGSGNVWLWDEDWPACVYVTIGFDKGFLWSCPNCGNEVDCESVKDADDLNDKYNETDGCLECEGE